MNFAIIAAGDGARMQQEGADTPKPLIELNGKSLIERLLDTISELNPRSLSIIINERFTQAIELIATYPFPTPIETIPDSTPSSMHSLYNLRSYLEGKSFFLFTVDTVFKREELQSFVEFCTALPAGDSCVAITDFIDDEKPLYVRLDGSEAYVDAFENERRENRFVTGGIYYFSYPIFPMIEKLIEAGGTKLRLFLRELAEKGGPVRAYKFSKMIDVDHIDDIIVAESFLAEECAQ